MHSVFYLETQRLQRRKLSSQCCDIVTYGHIRLSQKECCSSRLDDTKHFHSDLVIFLKGAERTWCFTMPLDLLGCDKCLLDKSDMSGR